MLAALLLSDGAAAIVEPLLDPADFFREHNGWCYEAAVALAARNERITITTLAHELERAERLEAAGGLPYLAGLVGRHGSAIGVEAHAAIIARDARWRRLIGAAGQIAQTAYRGGPDVDAALAGAEALILEVPAGAAADGVTTREALNRYLNDEAAEGLASGFPPLDALTGGFRPGSLIVVGARTSAGKSALLIDIARHAALAPEPAHVAFFTLEMGALELVQRQLAAVAGVAAQRVRLGRQGQQDEERLMVAIEALEREPMTIYEDPAPTVADIRARCRRQQAAGRLDLVVVDYLQLIAGSGRDGEPRAIELGRVSRGLKELAKDLEVPVLAAAQLSRQVDARPSHVPLLSDLRESGAIEQDADVVIFVDRPGLYDASGPSAPAARAELEPARLIVAKNRHGPTGSADIGFRAHLASFTPEPPLGEGYAQWWS